MREQSSTPYSLALLVFFAVAMLELGSPAGAIFMAVLAVLVLVAHALRRVAEAGATRRGTHQRP